MTGSRHRGLRPPGACAEAEERAEQIVEDFEPTHRTVFTTNEQEPPATTSSSRPATASSASSRRALDADGSLTVPNERSINKIGHALHDLDPVFERFSYAPELAEVAAAIGLPTPWRSRACTSSSSRSSAARSAATRTPRSCGPIRSAWSASGSRWRTPRSRTAASGRPRRAPRSAPQAVQAGAWWRHRVRGARPHTAARAAGRAGPAARPGGDAGAAARPAPPLERCQPLAPQPPRLLAALHLGRSPYPSWNWLQRDPRCHCGRWPGRRRAAARPAPSCVEVR